MKLATWMVVGTLALGVGCKKEGDKTPEPIKTPEAPAAAWDMAPAGAAFGLVIKGGAFEHARSVAAATLADASANGLGLAVAELHKELDRALDGADFTAATTWTERGIDLAKPFALFVIPAVGDAKDRTFMLVPVGDRARFRTFAKATQEKDGADEVDVINGKAYCIMSGPAYVCGRSVADARLMLAKHDSPLAKIIAALPADGRGDFTLWADLTRWGDAHGDLRDIEQAFGQVTEVGLAGSILVDGLTAKGWVKGTFAALPANVMKVKDKVPAAFASTQGASGVFRVLLDPAPLLMMLPKTMPIPDSTVDARAGLFDQLTGDAQLVTGGVAPFGATLRLGIKDAAVVGPALEAACKMMVTAAKAEDLPVTVTPAAGACDVVIDFSKLDAKELTLPPLPIHVATDKSGALVVQLGTSPAPSGSVSAGAPETRAMLDGPASVMLWARDFSIPAELIPPALLAKVNAEPEAILAMAAFEWAHLRLAEAGAAFSVSPTGATLGFRLLTFAGDPQAALDAYAAARKLAGAARKQAMAEIASKYASAKVGQRAALEAAGNGGLLSPVGIVVSSALFTALRGAGHEAIPQPAEPATAP